MEIRQGYNNRDNPKPMGAVLVDGKHVADSYKCSHCSGHWTPVQGSGRKRGYCMECKGVLCGSPLCMGKCIVLEARLQGWEGHKSKQQVLKKLHSGPTSIVIDGHAYKL